MAIEDLMLKAIMRKDVVYRGIGHFTINEKDKIDLFLYVDTDNVRITQTGDIVLYEKKKKEIQSDIEKEVPKTIGDYSFSIITSYALTQVFGPIGFTLPWLCRLVPSAVAKIICKPNVKKEPAKDVNRIQAEGVLIVNNVNIPMKMDTDIEGQRLFVWVNEKKFDINMKNNIYFALSAFSCETYIIGRIFEIIEQTKSIKK